MALGPIEVLVLDFPGNGFTGEIVPELERLVDQGVISVVDGLLVRRDGDDELTIVELAEIDPSDDIAALGSVLNQVEALISDDDVAELAGGLEPDSSAAILVFEHTWVKPLRDAIVASGGRLAASFRVPGRAVDELLDELAALDDEVTT